MNLSGPYIPDRVRQARHVFFEDGAEPDGLVDASLLRSWQRCHSRGRHFGEDVAFEPVERGAVRALLQAERALLEAANPALDNLATAVAPAGYAVLLTNAQGMALATRGAERQDRLLQQGLRPGIDLSEQAIGTTAMSVALAERRVARVLGGEHYFARHAFIHCCAIPVFNPQGDLAGVLDVTRDQPGLVAGTLALTQRCARRIETQLFMAQPAFVRMVLEEAGEPLAWLAFDQDARLLAATPCAWRQLELPAGVGLRFEDLFEDRFGNVVAAGRGAKSLNLRVHGGVQLAFRAEVAPPLTGRASGAAVPVLASRAIFGDARFDVSFSRALKAYDAELPLLIRGETGVGKEVVAQALHEQGRCSQGPFVAVNCGAIAPQLLASELFGHVEGAYTGTKKGGSAGRIEAANGGTLLLDEIGEMPLEQQVGLLRALDSGEIYRVGSTQARRVRVRVLCATHRDLESLVAQGQFREDLYYRIGAFTLEVPPLRERTEFDALLDDLLRRLGSSPLRVDGDLRAELKRRRWPGNVRQLNHQLRVALALAREDEPLTLAHFPAEAPTAGSRASAGPHSLRWGDMQQTTIDAALTKTGGDVMAAATLLGISRATMYRKLKLRAKTGQ